MVLRGLVAPMQAIGDCFQLCAACATRSPRACVCLIRSSTIFFFCERKNIILGILVRANAKSSSLEREGRDCLALFLCLLLLLLISQSFWIDLVTYQIRWVARCLVQRGLENML